MSVREIYNNIVSATNYGGLKEARDEDDNIIIRDYTLSSQFPLQFLKKDTRSCVVVNVTYLPKVYIRY